jgi:hypothetical protein
MKILVVEDELDLSCSIVQYLSENNFLCDEAHDFSEVAVYSKFEDEFMPFRQLVFTNIYEGNKRQIIIRRSLFESEDLIETILLSLSIIFIIAILIFAAVNYFGLRHLWYPFFGFLRALKLLIFDFQTHLKRSEVTLVNFNN